MINPQDGHILCDPKPAICGFSLIQRVDALKFLNERDFAIKLVDCRCECHEKQLLPDVFRRFVCNSVDRCVEDLVSCIVTR